MNDIRIVVKPNPTLERAMRDPELVHGPLRDALLKSAFTVERRAAEKAPVDTGRLRTSIASDVRDLRATVGSLVVYAPYVEFGTRPHWPPMAAMQPWARRHGFPEGRSGAFLVARAISRRGTRPHPYLIPALKESLSDVRAFFIEAGRAIERRWRRG